MKPRDRTTTIEIVEAQEPSEIALVTDLLRAYAQEFASTIAETLCFPGFEAEIAGLPGRYGPPSGCLLLAMDAEFPAGCVALRDLGDGLCEMKRLFVAPSHRGRGVGRLLVAEVIRRADRLGYRRMVLDSMPEMAGAIALYREYGFVETAPYWAHPAERPIFMERTLGSDRSYPERGSRMEKSTFADNVSIDMATYFEHLAARIVRLAGLLSDEELWTKPFTFGNSVGRIVIHLTGSLNHYIGAKVAGTGYVRDRGAEFVDSSHPSRDELLSNFQKTVEMVVQTLRSLGETGLMTSVADCGDPVRDRFGLFLVCAGHISNHVGQIVYLVQALGHPLDDKSW